MNVYLLRGRIGEAAQRLAHRRRNLATKPDLRAALHRAAAGSTGAVAAVPGAAAGQSATQIVCAAPAVRHLPAVTLAPWLRGERTAATWYYGTTDIVANPLQVSRP